MPNGCKLNEKKRSGLASNDYKVILSVKKALGRENRWIRFTRRFLSCDVPGCRIIAIFSKHTYAQVVRAVSTTWRGFQGNEIKSNLFCHDSSCLNLQAWSKITAIDATFLVMGIREALFHMIFLFDTNHYHGDDLNSSCTLPLIIWLSPRLSLGTDDTKQPHPSNFGIWDLTSLRISDQVKCCFGICQASPHWIILTLFNYETTGLRALESGVQRQRALTRTNFLNKIRVMEGQGTCGVFCHQYLVRYVGVPPRSYLVDALWMISDAWSRGMGLSRKYGWCHWSLIY